MAVETESPRTRRALLAAGLAAGTATVASALVGPSQVNAASGSFDSAVVGIAAVTGANTATGGVPASGVYGRSASTGGWAVRGYATAATGETSGVYGQSSSTSGNGVTGYVGAVTGKTYGVTGRSDSTSGTGVLGLSLVNSTGVAGVSGSGPLPAASPKTGVYGYAAQDISARGVIGETTVGMGVRGVATSGYGTRGVVSSGIGASGYATTGTAVLATSANPKVGTALQAIGKVKFDNSVGIATVAAGKSSVTVTPGIDLTATSAVVATLQGDAGGSTTVKRISVNPTTDQFTIYLTANATAAVKVAWHVFG